MVWVQDSLGLLTLNFKETEMGKTNLSSNMGENLIINPSFDLFQRGSSLVHGVGANSAYLADRWFLRKESNHQITQSQSPLAPADEVSENSLLVSVDSPYAVVAGEYLSCYQRIEGYNIRKLKKKNAFMSFWVRSNVIGTYTMFLGNAGGDRVIYSSYTIDQVDTWEKKIIRLPVIPTDEGTWNFDNGIGMFVSFMLSTHPSDDAPTLDQWVADGTKRGAAGQVDFANQAGGEWRVTQIQLHEGVDEIPFRELARDFESEVSLCQRYYEKSYNLDTAPGTVTNNGREVVDQNTITSTWTFNSRFRVLKRANVPIVAIYSTNTGAINNVFRSGGDTGVAYGSQGNRSFSWTASLPSTDFISWHYTADAEL